MADKQNEGRSPYADFWLWFRDTLEEKDMSVHAAEIKGGVGNATIGYRARHELEPTDTVLDAIAEAFDLPREEVEKRAGIHKCSAEELMSDSEFMALYAKLRRMTPAQAKHTNDYIDLVFPELAAAIERELEKANNN